MRTLASIPDLRTRVFAGASWLERRVSWAHVCELPNRTEYLAYGELLMTVGFTTPEGPPRRRRMSSASRRQGTIIGGEVC